MINGVLHRFIWHPLQVYFLGKEWLWNIFYKANNGALMGSGQKRRGRFVINLSLAVYQASFHYFKYQVFIIFSLMYNELVHVKLDVHALSVKQSLKAQCKILMYELTGSPWHKKSHKTTTYERVFKLYGYTWCKKKCNLFTHDKW